MRLDAKTLADVMEATWPPAARHCVGPFVLRDGQGGGKRVSAATAEGDWTAADLATAEAAMRATGQHPLFLIRQGDEALDTALATRGYGVVDPVLAYAAPAAVLAGEGPKYMSTFPHWPPMEIAKSLWAEGGIGPRRLAVMDRAKGAKCAILARANDRASGVAFVACHGRHAMLHGLEVSSAQRRQGSAHNILRAAASWAQSQGADVLSLVVTAANDPAQRLYASLGMVVVGKYHYRQT
jgi:ribosomal protein S18 acetylase RimI-like enzyme